MAKKKEKKQVFSEKELKERVGELDKEIFQMKNELMLSRKLEKPHLLKAKKKEKARILTRLTIGETSQKMAKAKGA